MAVRGERWSRYSEPERIEAQTEDRLCRMCGGRMEDYGEDRTARHRKCRRCGHPHIIVSPRHHPNTIPMIG